MAAVTRYDEVPARSNPLIVAGVIVAGIVLAVAVMTAETWALAGLVGLFLFAAFSREPVWGLYVTTGLLLLSGISVPVAGTLISFPQSAAKLCGAAALAAWLANWLSTGKRFRADWDVWAVLAFAAWALVGVSMSLIWRIQLPEWSRMFAVVGYFLFAIHVLDTHEKLHKQVILLVACGGIMAVYAVMQYLMPSLQITGVAGIQRIGEGAELAFIDPEGVATGAATRVTGGTGHSNWLAFTLLLVLPLNVYWYATRKTRTGRVFVALVSLVELMALVLTFTRLGLLVGVLVALVLVMKRAIRLTPHRVGALAVAVLVAWFLLPQPYKERVIDFTKYARSESTEARIELQQYAWQYMQQYPIVGIGIAGFGPRFYEENTDIAAMLRWMVKYLGWNPIYYGPHNFYLQIGAEMGTVGLVLGLLFILRALLNAQRAERIYREHGEARQALLAAGVTVSVLAFIFCGLFLHALQQKIWWMIFAVAAALPYCAARLEMEASSTADENHAAP